MSSSLVYLWDQLTVTTVWNTGKTGDIYGLYFSNHHTHIINYNLSHVGPLWAASIIVLYSSVKQIQFTFPALVINKVLSIGGSTGLPIRGEWGQTTLAVTKVQKTCLCLKLTSFTLKESKCGPIPRSANFLPFKDQTCPVVGTPLKLPVL